MPRSHALGTGLGTRLNVPLPMRLQECQDSQSFNQRAVLTVMYTTMIDSRLSGYLVTGELLPRAHVHSRG